jgi:hypothetical protein
MEPDLLDFCFIHASIDICLVGKHEQTCPRKSLAVMVSQRSCRNAARSYLFLQKAMKLLPTVIDSQSIRGIHHPNQGISLLKVIPPVGSEGLLATNIP